MKHHPSESRQQQDNANFEYFVNSMVQRYAESPDIPNFVMDNIEQFRRGEITAEYFAYNMNIALCNTPDLLGLLNQFVPVLDPMITQAAEHQMQVFAEHQQQMQSQDAAPSSEDFLMRVEARLQQDPARLHRFSEILQLIQEGTWASHMHPYLEEVFQDCPYLLEELYVLAPVTRPPQAKEAQQPTLNTLSAAATPAHIQLQSLTAARPATAESLLLTRHIALPRASVNGIEVLDTIKATVSAHTWRELLRVMHLYSEGVLGRLEFVAAAQSTLTTHPQLWTRLKAQVLGDDERVYSRMGQNQTKQPLDPRCLRLYKSYYELLHGADIAQCPTITRSYRLLPSHVQMPACTGHSALSRSVLNMRAISLPSGSEDDSAKATARKNPFEEILSRVEDERCELDMLLETSRALARWVEQALQTHLADPLSTPQPLPAVERRALWRIYQSTTKDVLTQMQQSPLTALPVVLRRVRACVESWTARKNECEEEWGRQSAAHHHRALDYRSLSWKMSDRTSRTGKAILGGLLDAEARMSAEAVLQGAPMEWCPDRAWLPEEVVAEEAIEESTQPDKRVLSLLAIRYEAVPAPPTEEGEDITPLGSSLTLSARCLRPAHEPTPREVPATSSTDLNEPQPQPQPGCAYPVLQYAHNVRDRGAVAHLLAHRLLLRSALLRGDRAGAHAVDQLVRGLLLPLLRVAGDVRMEADAQSQALWAASGPAPEPVIAEEREVEEEPQESNRFGRNSGRGGRKRARGAAKARRGFAAVRAAQRAEEDVSAVTPTVPTVPVRRTFEATAAATVPRLYQLLARTAPVDSTLAYVLPGADHLVQGCSPSQKLAQATVLPHTPTDPEERWASPSLAALRARSVFVCGAAVLVLVRVYGLLVSRLVTVLRLTFMHRPAPVQAGRIPVQPNARLAVFERALLAAVAANDAAPFEDTCRELLGTSSYPAFSLDRVLVQLTQQALVCYQSPHTYAAVCLYDIHKHRLASVRSDEHWRAELQRHAAAVARAVASEHVFAVGVRGGVMGLGALCAVQLPHAPTRLISSIEHARIKEPGDRPRPFLTRCLARAMASLVAQQRVEARTALRTMSDVKDGKNDVKTEKVDGRTKGAKAAAAAAAAASAPPPAKRGRRSSNSKTEKDKDDKLVRLSAPASPVSQSGPGPVSVMRDVIVTGAVGFRGGHWTGSEAMIRVLPLAWPRSRSRVSKNPLDKSLFQKHDKNDKVDRSNRRK